MDIDCFAAQSSDLNDSGLNVMTMGQQHLLRAKPIPGSRLSVLHIIANLILTKTLLSRNYCCLNFTDEETEAERIK